MLKKIIFCLLLSLIFHTVYADTIWCKMFKAGCITEEQKLRQAQHCEQLANQTYYEALNQALADPSIWQLDGQNSAQDYANMRKKRYASNLLQNDYPS